MPVITVLPLSSINHDSKIYPTEVKLPSSITGLSKDSVVMLQQVRTISIERINGVKKAGEVTDEIYRQKIKYVLLQYFELD